jgi:hypothetical protein
LLWTSTPVYRDPTAWYHIVVAVDVTQATASNRLKLYVNGVAQSGSFSVTPGTTTDLSINNNVLQYIGGAPINPNVYGNVLTYHDGYFAEVNFVDGQQLTPSSFGAFDSTTGVWNPTAYTGSYGTLGYYLKFSDNSAATAAAIGKDSSGNGNNWTPTNISVTAGTTYDSMVDSPTNYGTDTGAGGEVKGSYCTLNPLNVLSTQVATINNGNLSFSDSTSGNRWASSTMSSTTGKWYFEMTCLNTGTFSLNLSPGLNDGAFYRNNGYYSSSFGGGGTSGYSSWTTNDVIGCAFDADAGKVWFGKQTGGSGSMVWQGTGANPATGANPTNTFTANLLVFAGIWTDNSAGTKAGAFNFGQRAFSATAPSGFKALCTQNLPTPTILNGAKHMAATTYTGTAASLTVSNAVNGVSFQPDWVWIKGRSAATDHALTDAVRGATKELKSNTTGAESTAVNGLTAFNSDGFSVGVAQDYNTNAATYVGWQWKGGGTAVTNTSGSISSQVSANPTAGFSVLTYTGTGSNATVGHGLGVTPSMVITKRRDVSDGWVTYHTSLTSGAYILSMQSTNAQTVLGVAYNSMATMNSTVYNVGTDTSTNVSSGTYVAYCFAAISGYSAFGSYTGNGSSDGPFVYLGFRPRFVMLKRSDSAQNWYILDAARNTYNGVGTRLYPNLSNADDNAWTVVMDFLSNGFKLKEGSDQNHNASGGTYIYAAFAENPFSIARAR